tara:strand:- start:2258 stop:2443 length:186 start_codon:yes stop_codon:yes gene_type:complete
MHKQRLLSQISQIEQQLSSVAERLYEPELSSSEYRELNKKKKKLVKTKTKLNKRLESLNNC